MNPSAYDLLGVGFGPSNLSLAIALKEISSEFRHTRFRMRFLERQENYRWHHNLLLPGSTMQISFLKDLATQRNPQSYYTFLNFLKRTNRLDEFINIREFHPSREEFSEYFKWVSKSLREYVTYGSTVRSIVPVAEPSGEIRWLRVAAESPAGPETFLARNLVVAVGGRPRYIGKGLERHPQVVHSNEFLTKLNARFKDREARLRFGVVGAGQSAVEMCAYLYNNFPNARIHSFFSGFAFKQSESSEFVNEVFMNRNTDMAFYGNDYVKEKLMERSTNYGVADCKDISALYRSMYLDKFFHRERVTLNAFCTVRDIVPAGNDQLRVFVENRGSEVLFDQLLDGVFLGTGFDRAPDGPLLAGVQDLLRKAKSGLRVNRDYSLVTDPRMTAKVFLQGATERDHGIPNTLLSVLALRAQEIALAVIENPAEADAAEAGLPQRIGIGSDT